MNIHLINEYLHIDFFTFVLNSVITQLRTGKIP